MRSEKNIGTSVLVHFDGSSNVFFIRKPGKENQQKYEELLSVRDDTIAISKKALEKYGVDVKIVEGGD